MSHEQIEQERRFLVQRENIPPGDAWPVPYEDSRIEQIYLVCDYGVDRLRRRFWPRTRHTAYDRTRKTPLDRVRAQERVEDLSAGDYLMLSVRRDPGTRTIAKWRRVFEWDGVTYELDMFDTPPDIAILEVEIQDFPDRRIEIPDFLGPLVEITGQKAWSNRALSSRDWAPPGE